MKELDKTKVYDLSELTSEEIKTLHIYLKKNKFSNWGCESLESFTQSIKDNHFAFIFDTKDWYFNADIKNATHNAKELFYTLENVQVNCEELSQKQIDDMVQVFLYNGYKINEQHNAFKKSERWGYLRLNSYNEICLYAGSRLKTTITYDKFMELFNVKEEVELRLIKEAEKRGFKKGAKFNYDGLNIYCVDDNIYLNNDVLYYGGFPIMNNGVWADIIPNIKETGVTPDDFARYIGFDSKKQESKVFIKDINFLAKALEEYSEKNGWINEDITEETKPAHYEKGTDTFTRMETNCTLEERLAFAKGNIDKYTWREKGEDKEDFIKIIKYANWAIKQIDNA